MVIEHRSKGGNFNTLDPVSINIIHWRLMLAVYRRVKELLLSSMHACMRSVSCVHLKGFHAADLEGGAGF